MSDAFILDAVRTPRGRGKPDGSLHEVPTVDLAVTTLNALRERNDLDPVLAAISSRGRTASVRREMHTSFSRGSRISICQTCVRRPMWMGRAVPVTSPEAIGRMWLALISWPTHTKRCVSTHILAAMLPSVSASAADAPPCRIPMVWCVRRSTGSVPRR